MGATLPTAYPRPAGPAVAWQRRQDAGREITWTTLEVRIVALADARQAVQSGEEPEAFPLRQALIDVAAAATRLASTMAAP